MSRRNAPNAKPDLGELSRLAEVEAAVRIAAASITPEGAPLAVSACQETFGAAPTWLAHRVGSTMIAPLHRTRLDACREFMRVHLDSVMFMLRAWSAARPVPPCSRAR